ncbi:MAG: HAD hydrolase family protein [Melioribacteraceae bacterium]
MKIETLLKFRDIKIFFFDLEGVLLNDNSPHEKCVGAIEKYCQNFNRLGAGFGIVTAREDDELIRSLKAVKGCFVISGSVAKVSRTDKFLKSISIDYDNVFYMGDELLDVPLLQKCGLSCAPKRARREVKRVVSFTSSSDRCEDVLKEIFNHFKKSKEPASRATKH